MNGIVRRIERDIGLPGLARILADEMPADDLQSLLMEVFRRRSALRRPSDLVTAMTSDRFVRPSMVSPLALNMWEQLALAHCEEHFEAVELSPLTPVGTGVATAGLSQDWSVPTIRRQEVVSDPTNVLALEAALRRKALMAGYARSAEAVHLAASHRVVRPQRRDAPGIPSHFKLFALTSSGRDTGHFGFEAMALLRQVEFILGLLNEYFARMVPLQVAYTIPGADPERLDPRLSAIEDAASEYGAWLVEEAERPAASSYYAGFCFQVNAWSTMGEWVQVADGGVVDWGRRLVNGKERMVIAAIGSERVVALHQELEV